VFVLDFSSSSQAGLPPPGYTLEQCYQLSLKRSDLVSQQVELINQAEELYVQARGAILPSLTGYATSFRQTVPATSSGGVLPTQQQNTVKISGDQPLFRGFREFAGLRERNLQLDAQIAAREQAASTLYGDVASGFYNVLSIEKDALDLQDEIAANERRVAELQAFRKIGRSRDTDVLTVQANLASLVAALESDKGQIAAARIALAFLTGLDANVPLADSDPIIQRQDIGVYLTKIDHRPEVINAVKTGLANEEAVTVAKGQNYPSVDLLADYYAVRPGYVQGVDWDVSVALSIPIYAGGTIQSQVRQAASVVKQSDENTDQLRRTADEDVRTNFANTLSDDAQVDKYVLAVDLAAKNTKANIRDYRFGLVTNLDVLTAITTEQEDRRALDKAYYNQKLDRIKLEVAAAMRPKLSYDR
jgi:outer membrane protein